MRVSEMYPGKYLKADVDVPEDEDMVVTIDSVEMASVGQGDDAEDKPIVHLKGLDKALVLNKTNANVIAKVLNTDDTDEWEGRKVTLFSTDVQFGADMVRAIRVRSKAPKAKTAQPKQTDGDDSEQPAPHRNGGGQAKLWRAVINTYTNLSVNQAISQLAIPNMLYSSLMNPAGPATELQLERISGWLEANGVLRDGPPPRVIQPDTHSPDDISAMSHSELCALVTRWPESESVAAFIALKDSHGLVQPVEAALLKRTDGTTRTLRAVARYLVENGVAFAEVPA